MTASTGVTSRRKLKPLIAFAFLVSITIGSGPAFAQGFRVDGGRTPSVRDGGTFVSLEGKFSIALPQRQNAFSPISLDTPAGRGSGDAYSWVMNEGTFTAGYVVAPRRLDDPQITAEAFASLRKAVADWSSSKNGKLVSDKQFTLDSHPAFELICEFPAAVYWQRFYLVSNRLYQVVVVVRTEQHATEAEAIKVLDSFKLLSDAEVAAAVKAQAATAEPSPLPQEPVVPRAGSTARCRAARGRRATESRPALLKQVYISIRRTEAPRREDMVFK